MKVNIMCSEFLRPTKNIQTTLLTEDSGGIRI